MNIVGFSVKRSGPSNFFYIIGIEMAYIRGDDSGLLPQVYVSTITAYIPADIARGYAMTPTTFDEQYAREFWSQNMTLLGSLAINAQQIGMIKKITEEGSAGFNMKYFAAGELNSEEAAELIAIKEFIARLRELGDVCLVAADQADLYWISAAIDKYSADIHADIPLRTYCNKIICSKSEIRGGFHNQFMIGPALTYNAASAAALNHFAVRKSES